MEKFIALSASRLRLDDLGGLASETIEVAKPKAEALGEVGAAKLEELKTVTPPFMALLNLNRASALTPQIEKLDKQRDTAFDEIKSTVKAALKSSVSATAAAAGRVMPILKPMWNIGRESIASQTAQIKLFFTRISSLSADITTLGIAPALLSLGTANDTLESVYLMRLDKMSALEGPSATAKAKAVVAAYDGLCAAVEVTLSVLPTAALQLIFDDMNGLRIKYIAHLPTPLADAFTSVAPIPAQVYTGRHLTPIPRVFYQTDTELRELIFAEDFTVSYRNNVKVGEAKLFVHGKGKYTGTYTTTFHIVEKEENSN
jgi:hypothetical protein